MNLFDQISNDIKAAMLARDKQRLEALRGIKKEFIEAKTAKGADGELSDDTAMKILVKMAKQRRESAQIYSEQNRPDLAEPELAEAAVIESYLPKPLSRHQGYHRRNGRRFDKGDGQGNGHRLEKISR